MGNIVYISENKIFLKTNEGVRELPSQRVVKYREALENIQNRNEWKTSGTGAMFTGNYNKRQNYIKEKIHASINSISKYNDGFIYSVFLDGIGGLHTKSIDKNDTSEGHIIADNNLLILGISIKDNRCAASIGRGGEHHLAVFELPGGSYTELTEGDSREDFPCYSKTDDRILFSAAGLARDQYGNIAAVSPYSVSAYDMRSNTIEELFESGKFDYIRPRDDENGNLYFIKRPYNEKESSFGSFFMDILLFPVRIVRAVIGLIDYFSIVFGGESINSSKTQTNTKTKQKSDKELFIEGNTINADRTLKMNRRSGEKFPGIIPKSWELVKVDKNGNQTLLKKGVLDYAVCDNGDILYSNGHAIIRLSPDGNEELVEKCRLATNITVFD